MLFDDQDDLDVYYGKVNKSHIRMGKNVKMSFAGQNFKVISYL